MEQKNNLTSLIEKKLYISLNSEKYELFLSSLARKSKVFNQLNLQEYTNFLSNSDFSENSEWNIILETLNISETYFYRDKNQIQLLESFLFPNIIEQAKSTKSISIWSAGCSSGEEVYTFAFILKNFPLTNWRIQILGSDVNPNSIQKAKIGAYEEWSLRSIPQNMRLKYFIADGKKFLVKQEYKTFSSFKVENILNSNYIEEFDLIVCRNVLIYLNEYAKSLALEKFFLALKPNGFLLLGHSEGGLNLSAKFTAEYYSNLVYYKKPNYSTPNQNYTSYVAAGNNKKEKLSQSELSSYDFEIFWQKVTKAANSGNLELARNECLEVLKKEPNNWEILYFLGHIYESENKFQEAEKTYLQIIQLNPNFLEAYFSLASFYCTLGKISESKLIKDQALQKLENKDLQKQYTSKGKNIEEFKTFLMDEKGIWIA